MFRERSSELAENLPKTQVNNSDYSEIFFGRFVAVLGQFWPIFGRFWPNWTKIYF
jgi:hypothetical protein